MARVVMVGATGFIGRHVLETLVRDAAHEVVRIGRGEQPDDDAPWVRFDLTENDPVALGDLLRRMRPDAIVNCAGRTDGSVSELVAANVGLVATLLEAVERSAPAARIVHVGSAAEYGPSRPHEAAHETDANRPVSVYGITKVAGTQLVASAHAQRRVDAVVLRPFNPVGARVSPLTVLGRVAERLRHAITDGEDRVEMGSLGAFRDFFDVQDLARIVRLAIDAPRQEEAVFNVGSGRARSVREVVAALADVAGFTGTIEESDAGSPRSATVSWQAASIERASAAFRYRPTADLTGALVSLWQAREA